MKKQKRKRKRIRIADISLRTIGIVAVFFSTPAFMDAIFFEGKYVIAFMESLLDRFFPDSSTAILVAGILLLILFYGGWNLVILGGNTTLGEGAYFSILLLFAILIIGILILPFLILLVWDETNYRRWCDRDYTYRIK